MAKHSTVPSEPRCLGTQPGGSPSAWCEFHSAVTIAPLLVGVGAAVIGGIYLVVPTTLALRVADFVTGRRADRTRLAGGTFVVVGSVVTVLVTALTDRSVGVRLTCAGPYGAIPTALAVISLRWPLPSRKGDRLVR